MSGQLLSPMTVAKIAALLITLGLAGSVGADTDLDQAIAGIEQRMRSAEQHAKQFIGLRKEVSKKHREMQSLAQQVRDTVDLNVAIAWESVGLAHIGPELGQLEQQLSLLTEDITAQQAAAGTLTAAQKAAQDVSGQVCAYRDAVQQSPYPSATQFTARRQQLHTLQDKAQWGLQLASRQLLEKTQLAAARLRDLRDSNNKLLDDIRVVGQTGADWRTTFQQADAKAQRAEELAAELGPKIEQLEKQKSEGESEVFLLGSAIGQGVSPHANTAEAVTKEVQLLAQLAWLQDTYQQPFPSRGTLDLPFPTGAGSAYLQAAENNIKKISQMLLRAKALDSQLEAAQQTLSSTQTTANIELNQGKSAIATAEQCLSALNLPEEPNNTEVKIKALIDQCDYQEAEALLASLAGAAAKQDLQFQIDAGKALESELRSMVETARGLFRECRLNKVTPILKQALTKARCRKHIDSIQGKLQVLQKKADYEEVTLALFKEADALYRQGKYPEALGKLKQAKSRTTCQRFRDSLESKIAIVEAAMATPAPSPTPIPTVQPTPPPTPPPAPMPRPCPSGYNPYGCS